MSAITEAIDRLFADPAFGEAALYTAPPAAPIPVMIYRARHDEPAELGGIRLRAPGWEAHVRQSEVPIRPRPGVDTFTIDGVIFHVRDVEEDAERTEWWLSVVD